MQPNTDAEIARREASKLAETASSINFDEANGLHTANALLQQIEAVAKHVKAKKEGYIRPLTSQIAQIKSDFKQPEKILANAAKALKKRVNNAK